MKIVLIIYSISWFILLCIWIESLFHKKQENPFKKKDPWYLYAVIIILAPLAVLVVPYILISEMINKKKNARREAELEAEKQKEQNRKDYAVAQFDLVCKKCGSSINATEQHIESAHKLFSYATTKAYSKLLSCLPNLSLPLSLSLGVMECEEKGSGDVSKLYVTGEFEDLNIFDHITVEDSIDGAWQAFLLRSVWHILPFFWHGGYARRYYIFSKEDVSSIEMWENNNKSILNQIYGYDIAPKIAKQNGKYYVSCCYWTNWGGLKRELVEITLSNGKALEFFDADDATLLDFDCGIFY